MNAPTSSVRRNCQRGADRRFQPPAQAARERRREAIEATLEALEPDLCALQEVWADEQDNLAARLAAKLGLHSVWSASPTPERWRRRVGATTSALAVGHAILSRYPIGEHESVRLPRGRRRAPGTRVTRRARGRARSARSGPRCRRADGTARR